MLDSNKLAAEIATKMNREMGFPPNSCWELVLKDIFTKQFKSKEFWERVSAEIKRMVKSNKET